MTFSSEDELTCDSGMSEPVSTRHGDESMDWYQSQTKTTAQYPTEMAMPYLISGLCSEAGEVAAAYKRYLRGDYGHDYEHLDVVAEKIGHELGDCLWYISELCSHLGLNLSSVALDNLRKLRYRQERGTIEGSGDDR